VEEELIICRERGQWIFCLAKADNMGRIMLGEKKGDDVDIVFYDLSPTDLIAIGRLMEQLGLELIQEGRMARRIQQEDLPHYG